MAVTSTPTARIAPQEPLKPTLCWIAFNAAACSFTQLFLLLSLGLLSYTALCLSRSRPAQVPLPEIAATSRGVALDAFLRGSSLGPISEEALRQPLATLAESEVVCHTDCMAAWREEALPGTESNSRRVLEPSMLMRSIPLLDLQVGRAVLGLQMQARLAGHYDFG